MNAEVDNAHPVIGCAPLYPPLELVHAAGFHPLILWELSDLIQGTSESDEHLQAFTCSVARSMSEFLLSALSENLSGFLFSNACDTIRNMPETLDCGLDRHGRSLPMFRLHVPAARLDSKISRRYLAEEIGRLRVELANTTGHEFSNNEFRESVNLYHRFRQALLYLGLEVTRGALSFVDYAELTRQSQRQPVEDAIPVVETILEQVRLRPTGVAKARVIVSGILTPPVEIIRVIENAGLSICGNDIASMHRSLAHTPESFSGPEEYYQDFYQNHFPCPTLLYTADRRFDTLLDLVNKCDARGVIFVGEKFCEYEFFEYPYLKKRLEAVGIRTLQLEFAIDSPGMEAQKTRIEAFAELLGQA